MAEFPESDGAHRRTRKPKVSAQQVEIELLLQYGKRYCEYPCRSSERKKVCQETVAALEALGCQKDYWSGVKVRQWWTNNAVNYPEIAALKPTPRQPHEDPDSDSPPPPPLPDISLLPLIKPVQPIYPPSELPLLPSRTSTSSLSSLWPPQRMSSNGLFSGFSLGSTWSSGTIEPVANLSNEVIYQQPSLPIEPSSSTVPSTVPAQLPPAKKKCLYESSADESDSEGLPKIPTDDIQGEEWPTSVANFLKMLYRYLRHTEWLPAEDRTIMQRNAECRMHDLCQLLQQKEMSICSIDNTVNIYLKNPKELRCSKSTRMSSGTKRKMVPIASGRVFAVENRKPLMRSSVNLQNIYNGKVTIEDSEPEKITCMASTSNGVAYIFLNPEDRAYYIKYNGMCEPTGFFGQPSKILVDEEARIIWAIGDYRVKGFSMEDLKCVDRLYIERGNKPASLAIFREYIVLANSDPELCVWSRTSNQPKPTAEFGSQFHDEAIQNNLDKDKIDWIKGRKKDNIDLEVDIRKPNLVCTIGDYLAVASNSYETIHLLTIEDATFKVTSRLVGHTAGITSLMKLNDKELMSGSADTTARVWDVNTCCSSVVLRCQTEAVEVLGAGFTNNPGSPGEPLFFTGGSLIDGYIDIWSLAFLHHPVIYVKSTPSHYPIFVDYNSLENTLTVLSRHKAAIQQKEMDQKEVQDCIITRYRFDHL